MSAPGQPAPRRRATDSAVPFGLVLIVLGVILMLDAFDVVDVGVGQLVLPALLLVTGLILLQAGARIRAATFGVGAPAGAGAVAGPTATAVFGDADLLVAAEGIDTDRIVVTATSVFGDVRVEVPAGWRVEDRVTRFLGEVKMPDAQAGDAQGSTIEVHGLALFGDVRVRHVEAGRDGR